MSKSKFAIWQQVCRPGRTLCLQHNRNYFFSSDEHLTKIVMKRSGQKGSEHAARLIASPFSFFFIFPQTFLYQTALDALFFCGKKCSFGAIKIHSATLVKVKIPPVIFGFSPEIWLKNNLPDTFGNLSLSYCRYPQHVCLLSHDSQPSAVLTALSFFFKSFQKVSWKVTGKGGVDVCSGAELLQTLPNKNVSLMSAWICSQIKCN